VYVAAAQLERVHAVAASARRPRGVREAFAMGGRQAASITDAMPFFDGVLIPQTSSSPNR